MQSINDIDKIVTPFTQKKDSLPKDLLCNIGIAHVENSNTCGIPMTANYIVYDAVLIRAGAEDLLSIVAGSKPLARTPLKHFADVYYMHLTRLKLFKSAISMYEIQPGRFAYKVK